MKNLSLCLMAIFFLGCSTITTIELPEGDMVTVRSRNGSLVKVSRAGTEIEVDKRGRASFLEQVISMMVVNTDLITKAVED